MAAIEEEEIGNAREAGLCCPRCEAANLPQRKFCAKCGSPLWEPCFQCGEVCAAGENFCGACGMNLAEAAAEQLERIGDDFRTAAELRDEGRLDEAMALLSPIAGLKHPRMAERAARAAQLIRHMTAERDRRRIVVEDALDRARRSFDAFDGFGAARILAGVPPSLHDARLESLQLEIDARRKEIDALDHAVREAIREKRLVDLPPLVERLLAIDPNNAQAKLLAEQVRKHLAEAAESQFAQRRYDEVLHLLRPIAADLRNARAQEIYRQATELAWMIDDLRNAPTVDATLAAIAGRLQKLSPDDPKLMKLCDEVRRRMKLSEAAPKTPPAPWRGRRPKRRSAGRSKRRPAFAASPAPNQRPPSRTFRVARAAMRSPADWRWPA